MGKPRSQLTDAEKEAHRKANREFAARERTAKRDHVNNRNRKSWGKCRAKRNATRNDKYERDWERQRRTWEAAMIHIFGDLLDTGSLVSANAVKEDRTRYRGPGARRERQLEAQADAWLRRHARKKKA